MPQVLTTNALITCPHGGKGTSIPSVIPPIYVVSGGAVLLEGDTGTLACPYVTLPCVGYTLKSMKLNATQVAGRQVVLVSDFNQTLTGLPLLIQEFHNTTFDNSTPAPIPPGGGAPQLPPELTDFTQPVVAAAPPALAFNSTTMVPPTAAFVFTLFSDHPLQWVLTLINEPQAINVDLTNVQLPGLAVVPTGGAWNTPTLVVIVTMTAAFMAALGVGTHRFFMTGVSQRGISNYFEAVLTVS